MMHLPIRLFALAAAFSVLLPTCVQAQTLQIKGIVTDSATGKPLENVSITEKNAGSGKAGASYSTGVAGHGGLSPYEVHIPLMASGPGFKKQYTDTLPTSNVDLVPTVLHLHHLPVPASMEGRVMSELLNERTRSALPVAVVETIDAVSEGGTYHMELHRTLLGKYKYVDFATIKRDGKPGHVPN